MAADFAKQVKFAKIKNDTDALFRLFSPLDVDDALYEAVVADAKDCRPALKRILGGTSKDRDKDAALVEFVAFFLDYVRDGGWVSEEGLLVKLSASKLGLCLTAARNILNLEEDWIAPCIRALVPDYVTLSMLADELTQDHEAGASGAAVRNMTTVINAAKVSPRGPRQRLVLYIANQWFRICFRVQNPTRARDILLVTREARNRLEDFHASDQVVYLYNTGLVSAFLGDLDGASETLGRSLDKCTRDSYVNCRRILVQLTAVRLPLGIFPRPELLAEFGLQDQFGSLIEALKHGNYLRVVQELDRWREWFLSQGIYLMLREKLEVVCWRNLMKRVFWSNGHPTQQRPPAMKLQLYANAVQAFIDPEADLEDVESMCASLIDQGYVKAYIHHAGAQMVFQKAPPYGFPKLAIAARKRQPPQFL